MTAQKAAERMAAGQKAAEQKTAGQVLSGQITVRPMTESDLTEVAALEAETFSMPWSRKSLAGTLCREDVLFLVARGETLLGYAGVYMTVDEGEITNVAVAQKARRRGVAGRLLEELKKRLAGERIYRLVLEVRVSNVPAIRLYESSGFVIAGTRRGFYERPAEDAYVMVCEPTVPYGNAGASSLQ